jgi:hypothetical protein
VSAMGCEAIGFSLSYGRLEEFFREDIFFHQQFIIDCFS